MCIDIGGPFPGVPAGIGTIGRGGCGNLLLEDADDADDEEDEVVAVELFGTSAGGGAVNLGFLLELPTLFVGVTKSTTSCSVESDCGCETTFATGALLGCCDDGGG